jgi:hypothetical protein
MHPNDYTCECRMATDADLALEAFDHTKLAAINTCPTWGILRYQMHKSVRLEGRAMALEAGGAMHEVFSWVRLASLVAQQEERGRDQQFIDQLYKFHGTRLFGHERLAHIDSQIRDENIISEVCKRGAIAVLDSGGFHDDPRDKRRTMSNLEEAAFAYINRWRFDHPVWIRDGEDPTSDVGIEIPFDVVVSITGMDMLRFRLTGRIDGIHYDGLGRLTIHDNKTASRLNDAWSMSQQINHQYTGYCVAASVFTQQVVSNAEVLGLAIPLPKTYDFGGFMKEPMQRHQHHIKRWLAWLVHTIQLANLYHHDPINAPKYTHSCNRYFRPCSLIPFCYGDDNEQQQFMEEMVDDEWSPLTKLVLDGVGNE